MARRSIYEELGIDPSKSSVREIFGKIVHNDFPGAFVNIVRDPEYPGMVFTKHPDGDGSKLIQRILHFLETGDITVFQESVDDGLSMNAGDIAACGFVSGLWSITQIVNVNKGNLPKDDILRQIALRVVYLLQLYREYGFNLTFFLGAKPRICPIKHLL